MHLRRIRIRNIRSIANLEWVIDANRMPGWHVIIGDNGSGKSSMVRATALALVGPSEAPALRLDLGTWIREGEKISSISLSLDYDPKYDSWKNSGRRVDKYYLPAGLIIRKTSESFSLVSIKNSDRHLWSGKRGWFSAGFGPFRRFAGGDKDLEKLFYSHPRLASHLSVFGENVALSECLDWLQGLKFKQLEKSPEGKLLDSVINFINDSELLPQGCRISEVTSKEVLFVDGNGFTVPIEDLSDGFRSILSMTFDLIRQMSGVFPPEMIFAVDDPTIVSIPGVVLIDEVDAHLHPIWQRQIGLWFRKRFPNMQFIVTTHSPLVCQAADVGTVFNLPAPGSEEKGHMVQGVELERLLYGNILDAFGTEMFGHNVTRSDKSKQFLKRLAEINQKEMYAKLTESEVMERNHLRSILPSSPDNTCDCSSESDR